MCLLWEKICGKKTHFQFFRNFLRKFLDLENFHQFFGKKIFSPKIFSYFDNKQYPLFSLEQSLFDTDLPYCGQRRLGWQGRFNPRHLLEFFQHLFIKNARNCQQRSKVKLSQENFRSQILKKYYFIHNFIVYEAIQKKVSPN